MDAAMTSRKSARATDRNQRSERGFTLLEVMMSMVIVTIGLVALLGVMSVAMAATQSARQDMIARQLAQEALEAIITARETADIAWDQIQNVGPGNGIFVTGLQPIRQAGADGIIGTADDSLAPPESMQDPGPDGIVGTPDDGTPIQLANFQRSILITPTASGDLRNVTITIQYLTSQSATPRTYVLSGMISQYR
jgi:prepilin-type N-terminal cleavage/methylation domain-containing protein